MQILTNMAFNGQLTEARIVAKVILKLYDFSNSLYMC